MSLLQITSNFLMLAVGVLLLRVLYLSITKSASNKSLVGRMRGPVKIASWTFTLSMAVMIATVLISYKGVFQVFPALIGLASFGFITLSLLATPFNQSCRFRVMRGFRNTQDAANRTVKNRYVAAILAGTWFTLRMLGKGFMVVLKVHAVILSGARGSRSSSPGMGEEVDLQSYHGYHGYQGYQSYVDNNEDR